MLAILRQLLEMFEAYPAYRLVVSVYGATQESFDGLTQRRGSWQAFQRGMAAARPLARRVRRARRQARASGGSGSELRQFLGGQIQLHSRQ